MKILFSFLALTLGGTLSAQEILPAGLPKPAGLKTIFEDKSSAIYSVPRPAISVREEAAKILTDAGWVPYGEAGETRYFKKGKVKALVTVSAVPNEAGKAMVTYMAEVMSADLPAPSGVTELQYSESTKRLSFFTTQSPDDVDQAYRKLLGPGGWATTMAKPEKDDLDYVIIYRHPKEGMIQLDMRPGEGKLLVTASYQTKEEVAAEAARVKGQGDALRKKLAEEANAPQPEINLSLPKGTSKHFATNGGYAVVLASGSAMEAAKKLSAALQQQGWKPGTELPLARETGMIELTKDTLRLSLVYMDPGGIPAEITIMAPKVAIKVQP